MKLCIYTNAPELGNDIADVARIFYGQLDYAVYPLNEPAAGGADLALRVSDEAAGRTRLVSATASGAVTGAEQAGYAEESDSLERKRVRKRTVKLAVYAILRRETGIQPPWGALTGIRPTRLIYQRMERGDTCEQALGWLRNSFDVTPEKLRLLKDIIQVQSTLPPPAQNQVELYVGIPFCVSRCAYCSFASGEIGSGKLVRPYVDALLYEIGRMKELLQDKSVTASTVYMGGGTPTSLPADEMGRLLEALRPLADGREFTVEAGRPDTIDREKLMLLRASGVTRISINPQTFHDETLERIGRRHTSAQTVKAYELARSLGFDDINMDLIAGLPGEDEGMFRESLDRISELKPDSLTVHSLAIKHASAMHLYNAPLPDGRMTASMMSEADKAARALSLRPYYMYRQKYMAGALENVAYARAGAECVYNVRMMEETGHVLALGAGAISKRIAPSGGRIVRAPNVGNIEEYIRRVGEMCERKEALWNTDLNRSGEN